MLEVDKKYFLEEYQKKLNTLSGIERQRYKQRMYGFAYGSSLPISVIVQMGEYRPREVTNKKLLLLC